MPDADARSLDRTDPPVPPAALLAPGVLAPSELDRTDDTFMRLALREAVAAFEADEVPVGALVVDEATGAVIGRGHNRRETLGDPTAHAEMLAITAACEARGDWRLEGCTLFVTLEPCPMCAGAALQARVPRVVFGADDPKAGAMGSLFDLHADDRLNHIIAVERGVRAAESRLLLQEFFARKRAQGKK